jgi:uncharacterized protein
LISVKPTYRYKSLADVPIEEFASKGKKGVLLDIDNTFVPYESYDSIPPQNEAWINRAQACGIKVLLYSNATQWKIDHLRKVSGLDGVPKAYKPSWHLLEKALEMIGATKDQILMIGDQFCTDILGGSLCGVETILVEPLTEKDWWGTKILRMIEWAFIPDRRPWGKKKH